MCIIINSAGLLKALPEPQTEVICCSVKPIQDNTIITYNKSPPSVIIAINPFKPQGDLAPLQACMQ